MVLGIVKNIRGRFYQVLLCGFPKDCVLFEVLSFGRIPGAPFVPNQRLSFDSSLEVGNDRGGLPVKSTEGALLWGEIKSMGGLVSGWVIQ